MVQTKKKMVALLSAAVLAVGISSLASCSNDTSDDGNSTILADGTDSAGSTISGDSSLDDPAYTRITVNSLEEIGSLGAGKYIISFGWQLTDADVSGIWETDDENGRVCVSPLAEQINANSNIEAIKLDLSSQTGLTKIGDRAFGKIVSIEDTGMPYTFTGIAMPKSITSIGRGAFFECRSVNNITIPDSVTSIGESAFDNCRALTDITIPNSVTSIESDTFFQTGLTDLTFWPESVSIIKENVFYGCDSLESITIPAHIKKIEAFAFEDCSNLKTVRASTGTDIDENAFSTRHFAAYDGGNTESVTISKNENLKVVRY